MIPSARELRSARMKLLRAQEHLGQLQTEHQRFIDDRNPYRMLREADPEPGYYVWRAKIDEPPPLEKWASLAGECVHAIRSALDHTAFALVQINRPGTDYAEFPVIKDKYVTRSGKQRLRWRDEAVRKLPGVARRPLAQVRWVQPYRRAERFDPLWQVHRLDIIDKHRHLNLVSPLLRRMLWEPIGGSIEDRVTLAGPFEDGTPVARFKMIPDPLTNMYVKTHFAFDIAFGEGEVLTNEPVMETLERLIVVVGGVVARFDRFFQ